MPEKNEAIQYLSSSIDTYREQLDGLQVRAAGSAKVVELAKIRMQREQLLALIEDATTLLSQLRATS